MKFRPIMAMDHSSRTLTFVVVGYAEWAVEDITCCEHRSFLEVKHGPYTRQEEKEWF